MRRLGFFSTPRHTSCILLGAKTGHEGGVAWRMRTAYAHANLLSFFPNHDGSASVPECIRRKYVQCYLFGLAMGVVVFFIFFYSAFLLIFFVTFFLFLSSPFSPLSVFLAWILVFVPYPTNGLVCSSQSCTAVSELTHSAGRNGIVWQKSGEERFWRFRSDAFSCLAGVF